MSKGKKKWPCFNIISKRLYAFFYCIFLIIWMLWAYFYIMRRVWILKHFKKIQWMHLPNKQYSLIVEKWSEVPWWKHNVWYRYAFLWSWRMGPWSVLLSFVVVEPMELYKNLYWLHLTNNSYNLCLVMFGAWLSGRRDSLCWVLKQASGNKNNAGSPFQAWAGEYYVLSLFAFSLLIWYIISEVSPLCTRYTL